jgi:arylsulfatase A-like enzyme
VAATHGSPWAYDTHVPVILAGPGIPPGRIARRVETVDLAPTIAAYLGTGLPSGTRGRLLVEVLTDEKQNPE